MNDELQTFWMAIKGDFGFTLAFTAWVTGLRLVFGFCNKQLRSYAEQNVSDAGAIQSIFDSRCYRIIAFIVNMLCSIKLPTEGRKEEHKAQSLQNKL